MSTFLVNITHAANDLDRATVGLVLAKNAMDEGHDVTLFLSLDGIHLARDDGYVDGLQEPTFPAVKELLDYLLEKGAKIWVCAGCFKKRGLEEAHFMNQAEIVGAGVAIKAMADKDTVCVFY